MTTTTYQRRVLQNFDTYEEAMEWARESAALEGCRFLVRYDAGSSLGRWEAIQSWLRNM